VETSSLIVELGFKKLEDLSRLLASYSRQPIKLAPLISRWETLELTLGAFNECIDDQVEHLHGQMSGRVDEMQLRLEKFSARWFELKPKKLKTGKREEMLAVIARVKEWQSEFAEVEQNGAKIVSDCAYRKRVFASAVASDEVFSRSRSSLW